MRRRFLVTEIETITREFPVIVETEPNKDPQAAIREAVEAERSKITGEVDRELEWRQIGLPPEGA